jgi:uncharacterized protein (TIGR03067 family)
MRACLLVLLVCLPSLGFAPAPFPKPNKDDLTRLGGAWTVLRYERGSGSLRGTTTKMQVKVRGTKWEFLKDSRVTAEYFVKVDAKASPRAIDMKGRAGELLGIYRIDGDQLEMVFHHFGVKERPVGFDKLDPGAYRLVMKREKQ